MQSSHAKAAVLWVDEPAFAFRDVVELTGLIGPYLHGLRIRRQWEPRFKQPQGGTAPRLTYTARDILAAMVIAAAIGSNTQVPHGDAHGKNQNILDELVKALDAVIDAAIEGDAAPERRKFVVPRINSPWCTVTFDLSRLVDDQLPLLEDYKTATP